MKRFVAALACLLLINWFTIAQTKIACIGNSITAGTAVGGTANAYPAFLQTLLGTKYVVHNDGVSTTTMLKSSDFPYWTHGMLSDVFSFLPNIITIKLGTNDTKPQNWDSHYQSFKADYNAMIDTLNGIASHPKIWLVLPVPVIQTNYGINDTALQKVIVMIKQVAAQRGLSVIDANTPLKPFPQYFSDGVHPNIAGEDTIAHVIYRALTAPTKIMAWAQTNNTNNESSIGKLCFGEFLARASMRIPKDAVGLEAYSLSGKKLFQCRVKEPTASRSLEEYGRTYASEVMYIKFTRR